MAEEKQKPKVEDLQTPKGGASQQKRESPQQERVQNEEKPVETKVEAKSEEKKVEKAAPKIVKKDEAVALGRNLHVSKKQCMYICAFIKNKSIETAIKDLEDVIKMKRVVPFKGEIPHRSEPGVMSGRYPISASKIFIPILKGLRGNVLVNQMDLDRAKICFASATWASRPSKRGGGRFKRANVILKAKEFNTTGAKK
jgi:large subunit ribosomal protein L22